MSSMSCRDVEPSAGCLAVGWVSCMLLAALEKKEFLVCSQLLVWSCRAVKNEAAVCLSCCETDASDGPRQCLQLSLNN